ncbi:hypothetical protein [Sphingomonas sp. PB4P5]|uniref:hypothetical protein n=1 Tax=Parasphingomonas puruogangriensis TaxID=3096155 RepID=UPI002FC82F89
MIKLGSSPLVSLYDRVTRAIEKQRSIQMTRDELDWLIVSGAYARLLEAVAKQAFEESKKRIEERGGDIGFLAELHDYPSRRKTSDSSDPE